MIDLLDQSVARIITPLLDASPIAQKIAAGKKYFGLNAFAGSDADLILYLSSHKQWTTRVLALEAAIACGVSGIKPDQLSTLEEIEKLESVRRAARWLGRSPENGSNNEAVYMEGSMAISQKILLLNEIDIFVGLTVRELSAIASATQEVEYEPGVQVVSFDDSGETLYLIIEGKVAVMKKQVDGTDVELDQMGSRDYFGEMALFDDTERSASIVTLEHTRLLFLHKQDFNEMVHEYPQIALGICGALSRRVRRLHEKFAP